MLPKVWETCTNLSGLSLGIAKCVNVYGANFIRYTVPSVITGQKLIDQPLTSRRYETISSNAINSAPPIVHSNSQENNDEISE